MSGESQAPFGADAQPKGTPLSADALTWEQYFSPENYWSFILHSIRRIQENQRYPELLYARSLSLLAVQEWGRQRRIRTSIRLKSGLQKCFQKINADSLRYGVMLG